MQLKKVKNYLHRRKAKFFLNMNLEILTPEKKLYSGQVYGVQLPGINGVFEVLEKHAPLVSALGKGKVKILKTKNDFSFLTIQSGFVEVLNNTATVLAEGAEETE
jgi:F-type H+-transporting ATPase subunit epsilon